MLFPVNSHCNSPARCICAICVSSISRIAVGRATSSEDKQRIAPCYSTPPVVRVRVYFKSMADNITFVITTLRKGGIINFQVRKA